MMTATSAPLAAELRRRLGWGGDKKVGVFNVLVTLQREGVPEGEKVSHVEATWFDGACNAVAVPRDCGLWPGGDASVAVLTGMMGAKDLMEVWPKELKDATAEALGDSSLSAGGAAAGGAART